MIMWPKPLPPLPFKTTDVQCPICHAPQDEPCFQGPNHVERGRLARWEYMGRRVEAAS